MVAAPAQLPDLSELDEVILSRLFTLDSLQDLQADLAASPIPGAPTTLIALYQWATRSDIHPWIEHHRSSEADRLKRRHLALLDTIAETTENPVERRRACTTILRIICARPSPRAPRTPQPPQPIPVFDEPEPPSRPPPGPPTRLPHAASRHSAAQMPAAAPKPTPTPTTPSPAAHPTSVLPDLLLNQPAHPRAESPINRLARLAGHNPRLSPDTG